MATLRMSQLEVLFAAAQQQLLRELMKSLPEKLQYPPKKPNDIAQTYAASGYNQALDKVTALIQYKLNEIKKEEK